MADSRDDEQPEYTLYRAKPRFLSRNRDDGGLREMQRDTPQGYEETPPQPGRAPKPGRRHRRRPRISPWRVLRWLIVALVAWLAISLVLFLVSAQVQSSKVSDAADNELGGAGYPLTSPNTILVLGSDARTKGSKEPGAQKIGQPSRSDSILLLRIGGGHNATLSIPRDTVVNIPGSGQNKINAAYAIGGPALAIRTVEAFTGIQVNHLVEVNFENFPQLIDALGGVTYRGGCVVSKLNGGFKNGGYTLRLKSGEQEINGKQALALARTRHNDCNPKESDLTRARRQQKILGSIKDKVSSFETFVRLPWVSWAAPKAIRSDMSGPSLLGLVGAELSAGTAKPTVLKPTGTLTLPDGGAGLTVDDASKRAAVDRFLAG
ncbi:LCP family protein [Solirubrobacter ginsenosidimutans]|uniref:LCP family protein n=1 Tax=Solirubrobacter ginsenosidimutans TaxID=490573 RepID=A0A9X3N1U7_9ACTN|nr:LCP family protein [Solirubrobacter ginsenosidimutans]MDA0163328.1 LCP family protein [Solirubrobacter ginsenosidimutans]